MPDESPIPSALPITQSGSISLEELEKNNRNLLRSIFGVVLAVLMMANVGTFSLYKAMESRVEAQERRIERMDGMLTNMLTSRNNASQIEEIEQQVVNIENQIGELAEMVRDNQKPTSEDETPTPTK